MRDQLQLCCVQKSQLNGQCPQILRNSVEEFLCGEREDEKKEDFLGHMAVCEQGQDFVQSSSLWLAPCAESQQEARMSLQN